MAVKSFIRGDFRTLIVDNDYPTNYKVYYNGKWNYIQDEESFVNKLNPDLGESYLNRFNLKVLDNNQWVSLAILENYYNKNEKRNSIFYRTITRENFIFKPRAVNFTEVDARLGLNNLQTPFASNEIKYNKEEIENITNKLEKDEILYKLGNIKKYDSINNINYNVFNKNILNKSDDVFLCSDNGQLGYKKLDKQIIDFSDSSSFTKNEVINSNFVKSCLNQNCLNFNNYKLIFNSLNTNYDITKIEYNIDNAHILNIDNSKEQKIFFDSNHSFDKSNNVNSTQKCSILKTI